MTRCWNGWEIAVGVVSGLMGEGVHKEGWREPGARFLSSSVFVLPLGGLLPIFLLRQYQYDRMEAICSEQFLARSNQDFSCESRFTDYKWFHPSSAIVLLSSILCQQIFNSLVNSAILDPTYHSLHDDSFPVPHIISWRVLLLLVSNLVIRDDDSMTFHWIMKGKI